MEKKNYKIINRPELTKEQIAIGINFAVVAGKVTVLPKHFPFSSFVIGGLAIVAIVSGIFVYRNSNQTPPQRNSKQTVDTNFVAPIVEQPKIDSVANLPNMVAIVPQKSIKDTTQYKLTVGSSEEEEVNNNESEAITTIPFTGQYYADARYAIVIKDSIYGPVNVSRGYGDYLEYKEANNKRATEKNSVWFKFTVSKDTLLTFHITPNLGTDDYDFDLFKCEGNSCIQDIVSGKLKPVRACLSWNTSQNCNTGLSNQAKDTTYEAVNFKGEGQGKTYSSAIMAKSGDVFYLMVNAPVVDHQEPGGFTIYFYNYLPKKKANRYNK